MVVYLAVISAIILSATMAGWRLGLRRIHHAGKISPFKAICLITGGVSWFLSAQWARRYADTEGIDANVAEWFAYSGKWYVLLAAMMFGHGWIVGTQQVPEERRRRLVYRLAVFGVAALIATKTIPVYFLLDAGRRDDNGFLRQSEKVEVTCGAVALLNYLERYQHIGPLTEREVSRICGVTAEGTTAVALVRAARHFGATNATVRVLNLPQLDQVRLPAIVSISTVPGMHHATLIIHLDAKQADFIDPAYGRWSTTRQRFQEIWHGRTVLLE